MKNIHKQLPLVWARAWLKWTDSLKVKSLLWSQKLTFQIVFENHESVFRAKEDHRNLLTSQ